MLVLSRKRGEIVSIAGGLITVTIVRIDNGVVRLGFEAPRDIEVMRSELLNRPTPFLEGSELEAVIVQARNLL